MNWIMDALRKTQSFLFGIDDEGSESVATTRPKIKRKSSKPAVKPIRFLFDMDPPPPKKRGRKPKERPPKVRKRDYKPLEDRVYNMMAGDVSEEDDKRIQEIIKKRAAEVRAGWSNSHERKANNYPVDPIVLFPLRSDNQ